MPRDFARCAVCLALALLLSAADLVATALLLPALGLDGPVACAQRRRRPTAVEISATVEDAQVFVDGELVGTLPLEGPIDLQPGDHTFKIVRRGYTDYLETIAIPASRKPFLVVATLLPVSGILIVDTTPAGARVSIDGQLYGETPFDGEVPEGRRVLDVRLPGRVPFVETVEFIAGESFQYDINLEDAPLIEAPIYTTWWFWAGVGVLASSVLVTSVILTAEAEPPVGPQRPSVVLPLRIDF